MTHTQRIKIDGDVEMEADRLQLCSTLVAIQAKSDAEEKAVFEETLRSSLTMSSAKLTLEERLSASMRRPLSAASIKSKKTAAKITKSNKRDGHRGEGTMRVRCLLLHSASVSPNHQKKCYKDDCALKSTTTRQLFMG
jgi:hypothetical protein